MQCVLLHLELRLLELLTQFEQLLAHGARVLMLLIIECMRFLQQLLLLRFTQRHC